MEVAAMTEMNPDIGMNVTIGSAHPKPRDGRPSETCVLYRGADALAAFRSQPFDLALIDIRMPGMDGYQLVHHMRAAGAALPVIVAVTGLADKASRRKAHEAGFEHYLVKPYEIEALEAILECRTERYSGHGAE
jgi:CheY-like chemotaxis protein